MKVKIMELQEVVSEFSPENVDHIRVVKDLNVEELKKQSGITVHDLVQWEVPKSGRHLEVYAKEDGNWAYYLYNADDVDVVFE